MTTFATAILSTLTSVYGLRNIRFTGKMEHMPYSVGIIFRMPTMTGIGLWMSNLWF